MPKTTTTRKAAATPELKAHRARLDELLRATTERRDIAAAEYEANHDDGGDVGASQDEGGGEADVTSAERDRLRAAISVETEALIEIDAALTRSETAAWATCTVCGGEIGEETFAARATVAEPAERDRLFAAQAELMPGFKDYEKATTRVIPVVVLERTTG